MVLPAMDLGGSIARETTVYSFESGQGRVMVNFSNTVNGDTDVSFTVNNGLNVSQTSAAIARARADGRNLTRRQQAALRDNIKTANKVRQVARHHFSAQPNGTQFSASAWTRDGFGATRARLYQKAGFTRPSEPGETQYGIIRNGRLVPDTARAAWEN